MGSANDNGKLTEDDVERIAEALLAKLLQRLAAAITLTPLPEAAKPKPPEPVKRLQPTLEDYAEARAINMRHRHG